METKFTPNVENIKIIFRAATIYLIRKKAAAYVEKGVKKCDNKKYDHDVNDCRSQLLRDFLRLFGFLSGKLPHAAPSFNIHLTHSILLIGLSGTGAFEITIYF